MLSVFLLFRHRVLPLVSLYKARENKDLNFNIVINYALKIRDLEASLIDNDKYNKKWTVISNML